MLYFFSPDTIDGFLLFFFGHGLCYIPALTFINIRAPATSNRLFRISLAHAIYLCGIALGVSLNSTNFSYRYFFIAAEDLNLNFAFVLIIYTLWIALVLGVVEILRFKYVYKKSLDDDFQRHNEDGEIFLLDEFQVITTNVVKPQKIIIQNSSKFKSGLRTIFAVSSKVTSFIFLFYPIHFLNWNRTTPDFLISPWIAFIGALASSMILVKYGLRNSFIASSILKIFALFFLTYTKCNFMLWLSFFILGFGYSYADLNIIDLTSLKYNEIVLWIGYSIEMIIIGATIYLFNVDPYVLLNLSSNYLVLKYNYVLGFNIIFVVIIFGATVLVPKVLSKSILDNRNILRLS